MQEKIKEFLEVPKPKHHVWGFITLIIVLAIIALLTWGYNVFIQKNSGELKISDVDRIKIMSNPSLIPPQNPELTDEERRAIMMFPR